MPKITVGPISAADLSSQGRLTYENQALRDLVDQLINQQNSTYQPLPPRYPVNPKTGKLIPNETIELIKSLLFQNVQKKASSPRNFINVAERYPSLVPSEVPKKEEEVRTREEDKKNYEAQVHARNRDIETISISKIPNRGPSIKSSRNLDPTGVRLEATKLKKLSGLPITGDVDVEFEDLDPSRVRTKLHEYQRKYEKKYLDEHPEIREKVKRSIPEVLSTAETDALNTLLPKELTQIPKTHASALNADPLVQQAVQDDSTIAKNAIKGAMGEHHQHRRERLLDKIENVGESILPAANDISNYLSDRYKKSGNVILNEMTDNYLNNILPKGNLGFMNGAWNSPQRGSHQANLLKAWGNNIENQLMKMEADSAKTGLAEAGEQQKRQLTSGQLGSEAVNRGLESQVNAAQGLGELQKVEDLTQMTNLDALAKMGQAEQQAEENRLGEIQKEAARAQGRPVENTLQALNAIKGIPQQYMPDVFVQQQQPNYAAQTGIGLGNLATSLMAQPKAAGGLVQKFAEGGMVDTYSQPMNDPYFEKMQQHAESMANTPEQQVNPMASAIARMTDAMAERYTGMPGIATPFAEAYENQAKSQNARKIQGMNLMQQVHTQRVKQQEFLSDLNFKNKQLASREKEHSQSLGETSRHHKAMEGFREREFDEQQAAPKLTPTDRKAEREAIANLRRAKSMKGELSDLQNLLKGTTTGPAIGKLRSLPLIKDKKTDEIEVATNKLILDMHQGMKNIPRSEEFMKRIESTKPGVQHHEKANKKAIELMKEGATDIEQNSIDTLIGLGYSPEKIEEMMSGHGENHKESSDEMVSVISPDGTPGTLPAHNLDKALARGYKRAA